MARRKGRAELNYAYAFAASPRFVQAAEALRDALVENGFQRMETQDLVVPQEDQPGVGTLPFPVSEPVSAAPDLDQLPPAILKRVTYEEGSGLLTISGAVSEDEVGAIQGCFTKEEDRAAVARIAQAIEGRGLAPTRLDVPRVALRVPALAIRAQDELALFDESHFRDDMEWNIAECVAELSEEEFPAKSLPAQGGEVDVDDDSGRIEIRFV